MGRSTHTLYALLALLSLLTLLTRASAAHTPGGHAPAVSDATVGAIVIGGVALLCLCCGCIAWFDPKPNSFATQSSFATCLTCTACTKLCVICLQT